MWRPSCWWTKCNSVMVSCKKYSSDFWWCTGKRQLLLDLLPLSIQSVNIMFASIVTNGTTFYLKHFIKYHYKLFKSLFSQKRLLPKHNFIAHDPLCIRKIGTLLYIWCMRFEAKHKFFFFFFLKDLWKISKILQNYWKKQQQQPAYHWENFDFQKCEIGPVNKGIIVYSGSDWTVMDREMTQKRQINKYK